MKDKTSEKENKKILKDKQKKINNNEDKILVLLKMNLISGKNMMF